MKPRDGDDIEYPKDRIKSDKRKAEKSNSIRLMENEDSSNANSKKNKQKNFKNQQQEMPKRNLIDADFDTFNANTLEKPQPKKIKSNAKNNNNDNSNNLRNIKEEDNETEYDNEVNKYRKVRATNDVVNNSKAADKKLEPKSSYNNNNNKNKDKEEVQYSCDNDNPNSEFSKKTRDKLNRSGCSDVISMDNLPLTRNANNNNQSTNNNKSISKNNTNNTNSNSKSDNSLNAVNKVFQNKNYRLEIFIESFYLYAIDTDNFGPQFLPYLEIILCNEPVEKINIYKDQDNSKLDISNNSNNISDLDISVNMNQSYINNAKNNTAKNFLFKHYKSYLVTSKSFYETDSNLIFSIKNGLLFKKSDNKNNANIPIITIGSESVNLGKFIRTHREDIFDGCLEMKLRKSSVIGKLNLTILLREEKSVNLANIDMEKQSLFFDEYILSKNQEDFFDDAVSQKSLNMNGKSLWKSNFNDSDEITNDLTLDFFLNEETKSSSVVKNCYFKMALNELGLDSKADAEKQKQKDLNDLNDESNNNCKVVYVNELGAGEVIDEEFLRDLLVFECIKKKNKFAILQLLYAFLIYFQTDQFDIFDRFLAILDESQIKFFIEIYKLDDKNLLLYKYFLTVMDSYVLYHKNNQVN